jgi:hypothetical protein
MGQTEIPEMIRIGGVNMIYKCKFCDKTGTKQQLKDHGCVVNRVPDSTDDDSYFMSTLILISAMSSESDMSVVPSSGPDISDGGGEFSGGGASDSYGSSDSDSGGSDSDGSD